MPKAYPRELRDDVVVVAQRREPGVTIKQIAEEGGDPFSLVCLTPGNAPHRLAYLMHSTWRHTDADQTNSHRPAALP